VASIAEPARSRSVGVTGVPECPTTRKSKAVEGSSRGQSYSLRMGFAGAAESQVLSAARDRRPNSRPRPYERQVPFLVLMPAGLTTETPGRCCWSFGTGQAL
jgi:hypothetical protein